MNYAMRTIRFIVDKQTITLDPSCDISGLVPGTSGYVKAEFSFSPEWNDCKKVVAFFSNLGKEFTPQILTNRNVCNIPEEALKRAIFKVQVLGTKDDKQVSTNTLTIYQMRTIKFIVNGQNIALDHKCNIDDLAPGTSNYVKAEFSFTSEWSDCKKVAAFYSNLGREYKPQILINDNCVIPTEALERAIFKIKIIGQCGEYRLSTNKLTVHQRGGIL